MITRWFYAFLTTSSLIISCGVTSDEQLKYEEKGFNELAAFILNQDDIYEMDDFSRYHKSVNEVSVKLTNTEGNQNARLLNEVEKSLSIESKLVSALRIKLEETKLREFIKSGDTILFTVDGMLDTSWGYMYSKSGLKMDTSWFNFKGSSVKFIENINSNWNRTIIK